MSTMHGKAAVVTGAGTGIGKAIARKLGERGARIAICGRRSEVLEEAVAEMKGEGIDAWQAVCDVSELEDVQRYFEKVKDRFGQVDILVNNAGGSGTTLVSSPDFGRWDAVIGANLNGLYYCTSKAVAIMPDGGRILNISSILGKFGVPGYAAYCTSKHGVVGFTRAAALELAHRKITVNAICPGWVETDMARLGMEAGAKARDISYEEFRRGALNAVPLKEMIEPSEVAEFAAYLLSPAASNITGQSINICGGQVMH